MKRDEERTERDMAFDMVAEWGWGDGVKIVSSFVSGP